MKKKSIKIAVKEPCHEDWGKMSAIEQGKFCDSCAKPVIDFSNSTDVEIIRFLEEHKGQNICGRFHAHQLERPIQVAPVNQYVASNFSLRAVLLGATLSSLLGLESCKTKKAAVMGFVSVDKEMPMAQNNNGLNLSMVHGGVETETFNHLDEKLMSGIVVDSEENTIRNAMLRLFDQNNVEIAKTSTKNDGSFRLALDWEKKPSYVQVSSDYHSMVTIRLNRTESLQEMKIILPEEIMLKGEVEVIENK